MSTLYRNTARPDPIVPRWALAAAGLAILASIVAAAIGGSHTPLPPAAVELTRTLDFADAPDGAVLVTDSLTHSRVARLAPGTNGFVRATLRALAHNGGYERVARPAHNFVVTAWSNGRLTLDDPATGNRLDLEAFGSLNVQSFAALLTAREQK